MSQNLIYNRNVVGLRDRDNPVQATSDWMAFGQKQFLFRDIEGIRSSKVQVVVTEHHGGRETKKFRYHIDLLDCRGNEHNFVLDFHPDMEATGDKYFSELLDVLYAYAGNRLVKEFTNQLKAGKTFQIGEMKVTAEGPMLLAPGFIMKKEKPVPWSALKIEVRNGKAKLQHVQKPKWNHSLQLKEAWNASVFLHFAEQMQRGNLSI